MNKIIFLLPSLNVSGVPILFELANRLIERNHDVRITSLDELTSPLYPLQVQPQKIQDSLEFLEKADAIIAYHPSCAFYINDLDVKAKKFYFLTDDIKRFYTRKVIKANFPQLDENRIEIEYEAQQKYLEASYQLPFKFITTNNDLASMMAKKASVVPIGINHKLFYPELAIPKSDVLRILIEGNLLPWKGVESVNRALSDLRGFELWTMSNTKFTIKSDKHWMNPTVDGTRKILSSCDILIRTYYEDGLADLSAQAMACGCAVITRETSGSKMFCKHNENSLVFQTGINPKDDVSKIKTSIEKLMKNKKLREKIVRGGLETAKKLNWNNSVLKLEVALKGKK